MRLSPCRAVRLEFRLFLGGFLRGFLGGLLVLALLFLLGSIDLAQMPPHIRHDLGGGIKSGISCNEMRRDKAEGTA